MSLPFQSWDSLLSHPGCLSIALSIMMYRLFYVHIFEGFSSFMVLIQERTFFFFFWLLSLFAAIMSAIFIHFLKID